MNIVVALATSSGQLSGVPRHAINVARCLLRRPEVAEVHLVAAPWQMDYVEDAVPSADVRLHLHAAPIGNNALSRNYWYFAQLPKQAAQLKADIVHLAYPVPVRKSAFHCPVVVTLHDLYPYDIPENFGYPKVFFNRAVLQQCLRNVDAIACVSQSTLARLCALNSKLTQNATVIYNAVERFEDSATATPPPQWQHRPFLLCVAQHRRNKNIALVLDVFQRLMKAQQLAPGTQLFIVGIRGPETAAIEKFIATSGLSQGIALVDGIPDAQLHWCYRNCGLVIAASTCEGFGLPVAEALLAGCHVVCSDIPVFREVGDGYCHFVCLGPQELDSFSSSICTALQMPPPQPVDLPRLSPDFIAAEFIRLYETLLPAPAGEVRPTQDTVSTIIERQHSL